MIDIKVPEKVIRGGEWEPIRILLENLAYIPKLTDVLSTNSVKTAQL
jgi:hypothetical protein